MTVSRIVMKDNPSEEGLEKHRRERERESEGGPARAAGVRVRRVPGKVNARAVSIHIKMTNRGRDHREAYKPCDPPCILR